MLQPKTCVKKVQKTMLKMASKTRKKRAENVPILFVSAYGS
jgi:hypothetical protein